LLRRRSGSRLKCTARCWPPAGSWSHGGRWIYLAGLMGFAFGLVLLAVLRTPDPPL